MPLTPPNSNPLSYLGVRADNPPEVIQETRAPLSTDFSGPNGPFIIGTLWVNTSTGIIYGLGNSAAGVATWTVLGPGSSDVDTLTGDSGGAISPAGGNINILGGDGLTVAGAGSTLTINRDSEGGYPITPFVVGASGDAGYTTIQAALNAATAAGGGIVYVQPGTYTEDLTLFADTQVVGVPGNSDAGTAGNNTVIVGVHTPPATGSHVFKNVRLESASDIFASVAAGTATLVLLNVVIDVTNGFIFDLPNWTGDLVVYNLGDESTNNGVVNNTGGSTCFFVSATLGNGTGTTMVTGGTVNMQEIDLRCPWDAQTGSTIDCLYVAFSQTTTLSNNSAGGFSFCQWSTGATAALTMSSSGAVTILNSQITSSNNPAIAGAGAGTLTLGNNTFTSNQAKAATLTIGTADLVDATAFRTNVLATGVTYSANNIDATGSDANISITVTPKGTGDFIVDNGDIQDTSGDIIATRSSAGGDVTVEATNSDNTNIASRAGFEAAVGGTSGGDPYVNFLISGGQTFTMGIDNSSANDDFVISDSAVLGTTNRMVIDGTSGILTASSGFTSLNTTSINDSVNSNTTINTGTSTGTVTIGNAAAGAITADSAAGISLDGATASNFSVSGASEDLTLASAAGRVILNGEEAVANAVTLLSAAGGIDADAALQINIASSQNAADAIRINASAGGIDIDAAGAAGEDITVDNAAGSINITAGESTADAIVISASDGAGGMTLDAGSAGVNVTGADLDVQAGNVMISGAAQQLQVEGGAATDFIGQATLVAGTVTVANTNIAATDKIFVQREGVAASTALGVLDTSISAGASFTITALQPGTPGSTETNDVSIVNYFIVRQL